MESDLELKYDYLPNRSNPAAVFDTMAKYVKSYDDLGNLLAESIGLKDDFTFQLISVNHGSIKSRLGAAKGRLKSLVTEAIFDSAVHLHSDLTAVEETSSEEEVMAIAKGLEEQLARALDSTGEALNPPIVDPKRLAEVLQSLSAANDSTMNGETLRISSSTGRCDMNMSWRFTGDPKEMFSEKVSHFKGQLQIRVKISVNQGSQAWAVTALKNNLTFYAKVQNEEWLKRYQEVDIAPISAKDVVTAEIEYDVYDLPTGTEIKNAKITNVLSIERYKGTQSDLFDN